MRFLCADLLTWAHHSDLKTVPDAMLLKAIEADQENAPEQTLLGRGVLADDNGTDDLKGAAEHFQPVSFAMSCRVEFNKEREEHLRLSTVGVWHCTNTAEQQIYVV